MPPTTTTRRRATCGRWEIEELGRSFNSQNSLKIENQQRDFVARRLKVIPTMAVVCHRAVSAGFAMTMHGCEVSVHRTIAAAYVQPIFSSYDGWDPGDLDQDRRTRLWWRMRDLSRNVENRHEARQ